MLYTPFALKLFTITFTISMANKSDGLLQSMSRPISQDTAQVQPVNSNKLPPLAL